MTKLMKSVSLILAVFIGINSGSMMAGKVKKKRHPLTAAKRVFPSMIPCSLSVNPISTGYGAINTAWSRWHIVCVQGTMPFACVGTLKAMIFKRSGNGIWMYVDTKCYNYTYGCSYDDELAFSVPGIPQQYGLDNIYKVNWMFYNGTCDNTGYFLAEIDSDPFIYQLPPGP